MLSVRARRLVSLLAALTALALAGCAGITTTPAIHALGVQDRVGAFTPAAQLLAGPAASQSSCSRPGSSASAAQVVAGFCVAAEEVPSVTRVGRWMDKSEYDQMVESGRVQEGTAGRTYVVKPAEPEGYTGSAPGSVFSRFNVPSDSLVQGGQPNWFFIRGPNITTRIFGEPPTEMPPATCIELVCTK